MIKNSTVLYINNKKYNVIKQIDNKFLLEDNLKLKVNNINQNRSTGILYDGKQVKNVIVNVKMEG